MIMLFVLRRIWSSLSSISKSKKSISLFWANKVSSSWNVPLSILTQPSLMMETLRIPSMIMGLAFTVGVTAVDTSVPFTPANSAAQERNASRKMLNICISLVF